MGIVIYLKLRVARGHMTGQPVCKYHRCCIKSTVLSFNRLASVKHSGAILSESLLLHSILEKRSEPGAYNQMQQASERPLPFLQIGIELEPHVVTVHLHDMCKYSPFPIHLKLLKCCEANEEYVHGRLY